MASLTDRLKTAETRAENAEKFVKRLLKEVDRLEGNSFRFFEFWQLINSYQSINQTDRLFHEKEKYKSMCDDLDSTYAELTGF